MKGGVRRAQLLFMFVTAAASGSRVTAQSSLAVPGLGTSATETSRYQALGIRTGGFTFYPSVKASVAYDDNIFSRSQRIGDEFVTIHPQLAARSNWSRHRLDVDLDGTLARYRRVTRENSGQYSARATGALDVTRTLKLTADALYAHQVEPRGTEGDIFATGKPLAFRHASLRLGAQDEFGRLRLTTSGTLESYRYGDMRLSGGGGSIGARDYDSRSGALRLGYQIGPRLIAFVSGSANRSSYLRRAPGGLNRNSSGFAVLGGVSFGLTDLLTGEAAIGYLQQNFAGSQFADDHGINYSGSLHWRPTPHHRDRHDRPERGAHAPAERRRPDPVGRERRGRLRGAAQLDPAADRPLRGLAISGPRPARPPVQRGRDRQLPGERVCRLLGVGGSPPSRVGGHHPADLHREHDPLRRHAPAMTRARTSGAGRAGRPIRRKAIS